MTETPTTTEPSRGGAPLKNRNRMKHGLRADRKGAVLGQLPKGAEYVRDQAGKFQRAIEADVREKRGGLGVYDLARCQTAATNRGLAALVQRWLRCESGPGADGKDKMPLTDRLACVKAISSLLEASDRGLKDLGLDLKSTADPWATLDAQQASVGVDGQNATEAPHDASDAALDPETANRPPTQTEEIT